MKRERSAAVLVTNTESLVRDETRRYLDALRGLQVHVAAVVWNAVDGRVEPLGDSEQYVVPKLGEWPTGKKGLERWLAELTPLASGKRKPFAGWRWRTRGCEKKSARSSSASATWSINY